MDIKHIIYLVKVTFATILLFVGVLLIVWSIPDEYIDENVRQAVSFIEMEEGYEWHSTFTYSSACDLDNPTDITMLQLCLNNNEKASTLEKSMMPYYTRYWHGYLIFLKPLLLIFKYTDIRYIYMMLHIIFFTVVIIELSKKAIHLAIAFSIAIGCMYFTILPYSLQFSSVFFIMYLFCIWILKTYRKINASVIKIAAFWFVGMITNFFDFLTAPLITLGIPLIIMIILEFENTNWKSLMYKSVYMPIFWGGGYAISWISKWIIGSIVLKVNVIEDAISQANLRISGGMSDPVNRLESLYKNFTVMLPQWATYNSIKIVVFVFLLIYCLCFFERHICWRGMLKYLSLLLISVYPYIWYFIFANHSSIHAFFTYRIQMITVFAVLIMLHGVISWK